MRAHGVALLALTFLLVLFAVPRRVLAGSSPNSDDPASSLVDTAAPTASVGPGDVRVHYRLDLLGPGWYDATIIITNMTRVRIPSWTLEFALSPQIDTWSSGVIVVPGAPIHKVDGIGPMKSIDPGSVVWFSFRAYWMGSAPFVPGACTFNSDGCTFERIDPPPPNPQGQLPVDIAYSLTWQGPTLFSAQIAIRNISEDPVDFWTLQFTSHALVTKMQNVFHSASGVNYDVAGINWTRSIQPGEFVWFTMEGTYTGPDVPEPENCVFNGFPCTFLDPADLFPKPPVAPGVPLCSLPEADTGNARASDIDVAGTQTPWIGFTPTPSPYVANYTLTNNSPDKPLRNWVLEFDMPASITVKPTPIWNVTITKSSTGNRFTVKPLSWNNCIEPGANTTFGFTGTWALVFPNPVSTSCTINGSGGCTLSPRIASATTTATETRPEIPSSGLLLEPPYPNPFASSAVVPFTVERTQHVELTAWDLQGRLVQTVFSGMATAGATEEPRLDGRDFVPGAYFLRLKGEDGRVSTRQVVFVR